MVTPNLLFLQAGLSDIFDVCEIRVSGPHFLNFNLPTINTEVRIEEKNTSTSDLFVTIFGPSEIFKFIAKKNDDIEYELIKYLYAIK